MYYVYFLFVGYRVAIGRTKNIYNRLNVYRRTHHDVFLLGVVEFTSADDCKSAEKELIKRFKPYNAFRDIFYLSLEMRVWIVENTIATNESEGILCHKKYRQERRKNSNHRNHEVTLKRERYHNNPEYREKQQKYGRERYRNDIAYRQRLRRRTNQRYHNDPEYREKQKEYSRKQGLKRRKKRAISENTLTIPF